VRWLRRECYISGRKRLDFTITISNFTPKPHTPFQWHSVSRTEFKRKQELLRQEFRHLKGVKANYTDVRISAMEDFIGRGDRRLSAVVRRAWELGAGMDSWWENLNKAFTAWENAIAESDLTWKYRQVEEGEWNIFGESHEKNWLDAPLPWDHINSGIEKSWLKEDLQKALAATTVPDCAFDGCSHCGVCGTDFGHNIVYQPPAIPEFHGEFQPDQQRVQRLRVWFGKLGEMALVSHLDLVRLFDRAVRRAALPVAFTNGFHPGPRISIANALSLGATSSGEIIDFELTKALDCAEFQEKLIAQLPSEIPIYRVEEVDVKALAATRLLDKAEYLITVTSTESISVEMWQNWIQMLLETPEILREKKTKSGKKQVVNLRERLFDLSFVKEADNSAVILSYIGSCRNDGTLLQPEQLIYMLEQISQQELHLIHVHRQQMILNP
jgi:radical SAM-linked protein